MKLYLIEPIDDNRVGFDCAHGFVVQAGSPKAARKIAAENSGDEGEGFWMDPDLSKVSGLRPVGKPSLILRDFLNG